MLNRLSFSVAFRFLLSITFQADGRTEVHTNMHVPPLKQLLLLPFSWLSKMRAMLSITRSPFNLLADSYPENLYFWWCFWLSLLWTSSIFIFLKMSTPEKGGKNQRRLKMMTLFIEKTSFFNHFHLQLDGLNEKHPNYFQ